MKEFTNFLMKIPAAKKLYWFWMEVEIFKVMEKYDIKEERMRVFRYT